MLTDILIYSGIALVIIGALLLLGAAVFYSFRRSELPVGPARDEQRARLRKFRLLWIGLSLIGCLLLLAATKF